VLSNLVCVCIAVYSMVLCEGGCCESKGRRLLKMYLETGVSSMCVCVLKPFRLLYVMGLDLEGESSTCYMG